MIQLRFTVVTDGVETDLVLETDPNASLSSICDVIGIDPTVVFPQCDPTIAVAESPLLSGVVLDNNPDSFDDFTTRIGIGTKLLRRWNHLVQSSEHHIDNAQTAYSSVVQGEPESWHNPYDLPGQAPPQSRNPFMEFDEVTAWQPPKRGVRDRLARFGTKNDPRHHAPADSLSLPASGHQHGSKAMGANYRISPITGLPTHIPRPTQMPPISWAPEASTQTSVNSQAPGRRSLIDGAPGISLVPDAWESTGVRMEFISGIYAGTLVALQQSGSWTVGRGKNQDIIIPDPMTAPHHLNLRIEQRLRILIAPQPQVSPIYVDGEIIAESTEVQFGSPISFGGTVIRFVHGDGFPGDIRHLGDGRVGFNRGSRIRIRLGSSVVSLPGDMPKDSSKSPVPWIAMVAPVAMGTGMFAITGRAMSLMFAAMSPLMVLGTALQSRRTAKKRGGDESQLWRERVQHAHDQVAEARINERIRLWAESPDAAVLGQAAAHAGARLWERRSEDPDSWHLRVGTGETNLEVVIDGSLPAEIKAKGGTGFGISPAPINVDLAIGVVGISGTGPARSGLLRWLVGQAVTTRSPREVAVVILTGDDVIAQTRWSWSRWVPHVVDSPTGLGGIGNTPETRAARIKELTALVTARLAAGHAGVPASFTHQVLVMIDGARAMRNLPGMVQILRDGPSVGVYIIAADDDQIRLPEECVTVVVLHEPAGMIGSVSTPHSSWSPILIEGVSQLWSERVGRAIAPLVHVGGDGDESLLPSALRLVDILDPQDAIDDTTWVGQAWNRTAGTVGTNLTAPVGMDANGVQLIDLVSDGPHGLVAGTTGAGKSEFLQTLVASLSANYRPDELGFVLVDYKGGSAFGACARLPHVTGLVTNLDERGTIRALASLQAELERRQRLLANLGVKDIADAWLKDVNWCRVNHMGRLVIVIDEFAELKQELPEFVTGMVRIGRVGRSLGVHIILATQRPAGNITAEMQSNMNLRVALRVTDKADSTDVIGTPEAAAIPLALPGRGYLRRGVSAPSVEFQTARVGGRQRGRSDSIAQTNIRVAKLDWNHLGEPIKYPPRLADLVQTTVDVEATDLRAVVETIRAQSLNESLSGMPPPWLPELPTTITVEQIETISNAAKISAAAKGALVRPFQSSAELEATMQTGLPFGSRRAVLGLEDIPGEQSRKALEWQVETSSHLLISGAARMGRSTTLRTLGAGLLAGYDIGEINIYGLDFGNGALSGLTEAISCGGIMMGFEIDRIERFLNRLSDELSRRQQHLAHNRFGDIREQRAGNTGADRLPYIVVLLDRWEGFVSTFGRDAASIQRQQFLKTLREGAGVGIRLVVSGDRSLITDTTIATMFEDRLILRMLDPLDYSSAGLSSRQLPATFGPGRAFAGNPAKEFQLALLASDHDTAAQNEVVAKVASFANDRDQRLLTAGEATRGFRVDVIPSVVQLRDTGSLAIVGGTGDGFGFVAGVGGDDLARHWVELSERPGFIVFGGQGSGRSTFLVSIATQLRACDAPVLFFGSGQAGAIVQASGALVTSDTNEDGLNLLRTYIRDHQGSRPIVLADNTFGYRQSAVGNELTRLVGAGEATVIAATGIEDASMSCTGVAEALKKIGQGIVLRPTLGIYGNAFGALLPPHHLGTGLPGRGALRRPGSWATIQGFIPEETNLEF